MVLGTSFHFDEQGTATAVDAMKRYCGLLDEQEGNRRRTRSRTRSSISA